MSPAEAPHTAHLPVLPFVALVAHLQREKNNATAKSDGPWLMPGAMYR
jgi:hypothetical protein